MKNFYSNQVYNHSLFSSHAFPKFSVRYFIYKKSFQVKKINAINREIEVGNVGIGKHGISDTWLTYSPRKWFQLLLSYFFGSLNIRVQRNLIVST